MGTHSLYILLVPVLCLAVLQLSSGHRVKYFNNANQVQDNTYTKYDDGHNINNGPIVNTTYGSVEGLYLADNMQCFLGIPFAAPPIGPLRWEAPHQPDHWDLHQAIQQPPACPQQNSVPPDNWPYYYSEDCLYLDIYAPRQTSSNASLPVMMFLYGGNFRTGAASIMLYDGRFLGNLTNTVVVVSNYRVGALGFMSTKAKGDQPGLSGNYGFMDQRAAMKFVHQNIAAFGGNPDKVTLFGQSAGAQSISLHLSSPESDPYFQQAIIQSNPFTIPYQTLPRSIDLGEATAKILNCDASDLDCLRSKSAPDVVSAGEKAGGEISLDIFGPLHLFEPWGPVIDGKEIKENPLHAFHDGKFQRKPVIIGTLTEEGRPYMWQAFSSKPPTVEVGAFFTLIFGVEETYRIFKEYNFTSFDDLREPASTLTTDYIFTCSTLNASRSISLSSNDSKIYHYVFDHAFSFVKAWGPNYTECVGHVCHGSELPFVFRSILLRNYTFTPEEVELAESMAYYWGNFAHTGDPNNNSWHNTKSKEHQYLHWPLFNEQSGRQGILFQTSGNKIQNKYRDKFCQFFDKVGYTPK